MLHLHIYLSRKRYTALNDRFIQATGPRDPLSIRTTTGWWLNFFLSFGEITTFRHSKQTVTYKMLMYISRSPISFLNVVVSLLIMPAVIISFCICMMSLNYLICWDKQPWQRESYQIQKIWRIYHPERIAMLSGALGEAEITYKSTIMKQWASDTENQ